MIFDVEPRGIEPLYPSVDHELLTMRWPLAPQRNNNINLPKQKARFPRGFRTFRIHIEFVIDKIIIPQLYILSI